MSYLGFLGLLVIVECAAAIVVMAATTIPSAVADYRETSGPYRTYAWWVLFRLLVCFAGVTLFAFVGVVVALFEGGAAVRGMVIQHALFVGITFFVILALSGPVEKRQIQRAIEREERDV